MAFSRRDLLKSGLAGGAVLSLAGRVPRLLAATAAQAPTKSGPRALVVLQLAGGNDGLNTVVPYADEAYQRSRPTLRLKAQELHRVADGLGLHPRLKPLQRLLDQGQLGIVQGVGYPNQDRSHPRSMRVWQSAQLAVDEAETGWIGRVADQQCTAVPGAWPALFIGRTRPTLALNAHRAIVPHLRDVAGLLPRTPAGVASDVYRRTLRDTAGQEPLDGSLLGFVRTTDLATGRAIDRLEGVLGRPASRGAGYPALPLAQSLRSVADGVRAELPVSVYYVELGGQEPGGFDTHANQAGNHAALMAELAESVAAFVDDLARDHLLDRVLLMTFSEFGRSLAENGRHGTDHGAASPLFLVGGAIRTPVFGRNPNLMQLDGNAPRFQIDFRQVYATVLERWLGLDSRPILGSRFEPLELLRTG